MTKKIALGAAAAVLAGALSAMERVDLNGLWDFRLAQDASLEDVKMPGFEPNDKMLVPGCWDAMSHWYNRRGTGCYRRTFDLDGDAENAFLVIDGSGLRSRYWIDGREVGFSKLPWSRLRFETGPLKAGRHEIACAVDSVVDNSKLKLFWNFYDFYPFGGFHHGVWLDVQSLPVELGRVVVRTRDYRTGLVELEAQFEGALAPSNFTARVVFDEKVKLDDVAFSNRRARVNVPNFRLWSHREPNLHRVTVEANVKGCRSAASARFGIRQVGTAKGRITLNGEPVYLKGVNRHESHYEFGATTPVQLMYEDIRNLKDLGGNFIRGSHYAQCEAFLDLCDELGVLVWEESLGWGNRAAQLDDPEFCDLQEQETRMMVRNSINHPCVIISAFLNEPDSNLPSCKRLVDRLIGVIRAEDTGHLVTFACHRNDSDISHANTDIIAFNTYPCWYSYQMDTGTADEMRTNIRKCYSDIVKYFRGKYRDDRPILVTEIGVKADYGVRDPRGKAQYTEDFQDEYEGIMLEEVFANNDIGGIAIWQFTDAKTYTRTRGLTARSYGVNTGGLYDLYRRPKLVVDTVRKLFSGKSDCRPAVLDELMPVPVKVEAREGFASEAALRNVSVIRADVPGARAETADEAYILEVAPGGVSITAPTARAERWARVTLEQLTRLSGGKVPCCRITDWPRFKWRGFMHDSGRNFLEVEHVKGIIDAMSRCKMNLFHWHFTEYYGWRLESKRYPELQKDSSFYLRYVGKYYTQEQFREVVDYALERGVTVMPEFDIPGHALAFRRAFGYSTMRDDGVREKLCDLVDELCALVPKEKMPFIHIGSDEARLPEEKVPPMWLGPIVDRIHAAGRTVVGWTPGELAGLTGRGPVVGMRWGRPKSAGEVGVIPFFDASGMYLDTLDPFELSGVATYRRMCPWDESEGARLGAITCAWHDDFSGEGVRTIGNQTVMPALVLFGDAYWRGRDDEPAGKNGRMLPRVGDPRLAKVIDIERRTAAQRDRVWNDSPYPFQFLRQTDMRWRVSLADGTLLAKDVAQATVFLWQNALSGVEGGKPGAEGGNLTTNRTGTAILETWIKAPEAIDCGAWIGFTDYTRDHGRAYSAPTPGVGQWSRFDATVEINGRKVAPPKWKKPGQKAGGDVTYLLYVHELDEIAFEDEEYYMREPTPIHLEKGWNHVKLTIPMKAKAKGYVPWVGTFIPLLGTTEHPREVPGLEYSAEPKQ